MDIIAAIDHATGCHTCGRGLQDSVSDLFCGPDCQADWYAERTDPLADYAEPDDLPQYVGNLVEFHAAETVPAIPDHGIHAPEFPLDLVAAMWETAARAERAWAEILRLWTTVIDEIDWDTITWHGMSPAEQPTPQDLVLPAVLSPATLDLAHRDNPTPTAHGQVTQDVLREIRQATFAEVTVPDDVRARIRARYRHRNTGPAHRQRPPRAITARRSR